MMTIRHQTMKIIRLELRHARWRGKVQQQLLETGGWAREAIVVKGLLSVQFLGDTMQFLANYAHYSSL